MCNFYGVSGQDISPRYLSPKGWAGELKVEVEFLCIWCLWSHVLSHGNYKFVGFELVFNTRGCVWVWFELVYGWTHYANLDEIYPLEDVWYVGRPLRKLPYNNPPSLGWWQVSQVYEIGGQPNCAIWATYYLTLPCGHWTHIERGNSSFLTFFGSPWHIQALMTWKTICGFVTKWFCLEVCVCVWDWR